MAVMDTQQLDASSLVDGERLETEVKAMYRHVAREEASALHFEVGRGLAEHLGYPADLLDAIPAQALASFAGVGYHLDLAAPVPGESVLDLGSGSGTDIFCAAVLVGDAGRVVGVDMTDEQVAKALRLRDSEGFSRVDVVEAHIETLPFEDASFDVVISNGVINLALNKGRVFAEAARVLRPGGRLALVDITGPRWPAARWAFDAYFGLAAPLLGRLVGQPEAYRYLPRSVARLPDPGRLLAMLTGIGFEHASSRPLTGGVVTLFVASRAK
jgi:ubiquinone/menaquinone biosynthesis C-methylase UbiE